MPTDHLEEIPRPLSYHDRLDLLRITHATSDPRLRLYCLRLLDEITASALVGATRAPTAAPGCITEITPAQARQRMGGTPQAELQREAAARNRPLTDDEKAMKAGQPITGDEEDELAERRSRAAERRWPRYAE